MNWSAECSGRWRRRRKRFATRSCHRMIRRDSESIFVRLVRLGDTGGATGRTAALDEFDAPEQALLRRLADDEHGRLLAVSEKSAEIAHEALITQWPWLQGRLKEGAHDAPAAQLADE